MWLNEMRGPVKIIHLKTFDVNPTSGNSRILLEGEILAISEEKMLKGEIGINKSNRESPSR